MARKPVVSRSMFKNVVEISEVIIKNGKISGVPMPSMEIMDSVKLTAEKAEKLVRKAIRSNPDLADKNVMVTGITSIQYVYTIPLDKFLEMADVEEVVEGEEPNTENGGNE